MPFGHLTNYREINGEKTSIIQKIWIINIKSTPQTT